MSILRSGAVAPSGCIDGILEPGSEPSLRLADEPAVGAEALGLFRKGRGTRVLMLAATIAVLSAADLYITGLYLATTGMAEENPLARLVMSSGSLEYLSVWKMLTVLPTLILMVAYRHRRLVEMLGWVACAVLAGVMIRWAQYADETHLLLLALQAMQEGSDARWVSLVEAPAS